MAVKKKVGFDFDKVFVNYPPVVPDALIDFLYKGQGALNKQKEGKKLPLHYRKPGTLEQYIRILSHYYAFRQPIKSNIRSLRLIQKKYPHELYLISSRFSFLKHKTHSWVEKQKLNQIFNGIYFNFSDSQPHLFKERMIKKLGITDYIDDDLDLLVFLSKKHTGLRCYWLTTSGSHTHPNLPENITIIKSVRELYNKYL